MMELREVGDREALQAPTGPRLGAYEQEQSREHQVALNEYQSGHLEQIPALAQPSGHQ